MPPDAPGAYLVATLDGHDAAAIAPADDAGETEVAHLRRLRRRGRHGVGRA